MRERDEAQRRRIEALDAAREDAYCRALANRDEAWEPDQMEPPGEQGVIE